MVFKVGLKEVRMEADEILAKVRGPELGNFAAMEWFRLYRKYMPYEPRAFEIHPWMIRHTEPYAHYDYEGNVRGPNVPINGGEAWFSPKVPKYLTGKRLRFGKGSDHWDQKAIPTQQPKLIRAIQAFIDGGHLF